MAAGLQLTDITRAAAVIADMRKIIRQDPRIIQKLHRRVFLDKITREQVGRSLAATPHTPWLVGPGCSIHLECLCSLELHPLSGMLCCDAPLVGWAYPPNTEADFSISFES